MGCPGRGGLEKAGAGCASLPAQAGFEWLSLSVRPTGMHWSRPALQWLLELELAPPQFPVDVTCYFSAAVFTTVELSRVTGGEGGQARQLPMGERSAPFPGSPRSLRPAPGHWERRARRAA